MERISLGRKPSDLCGIKLNGMPGLDSDCRPRKLWDVKPLGVRIVVETPGRER